MRDVKMRWRSIRQFSNSPIRSERVNTVVLRRIYPSPGRRAVNRKTNPVHRVTMKLCSAFRANSPTGGVATLQWHPDHFSIAGRKNTGPHPASGKLDLWKNRIGETAQAGFRTTQLFIKGELNIFQFFDGDGYSRGLARQDNVGFDKCFHSNVCSQARHRRFNPGFFQVVDREFFHEM